MIIENEHAELARDEGSCLLCRMVPAHLLLGCVIGCLCVARLCERFELQYKAAQNQPAQ